MSESERKTGHRYASLDGGIDATGESKCGIGRFTPSCMQCLANPKIFVSLLLPTLVFFVASATYTGAVLTTIEKEFQLSSTESGFLTVINDITTVVVVVFVSFLGHKAHRPRWIGTGILITGVGLFVCSLPHFSKDVFDLSTINEDFEIPDFCFLRNFDFSKIPGFDPSKLPSGFDPSKLPEGFDPSKLPEGFDPSKLPEGFDPSKLPEGFDPSKLPEGFDPSKLPEGFDPSKLPEGFDPSKLPEGFDPSKLPEGFDPSKLPDGFDPSKVPDGFDTSKFKEGFDPSNLPNKTTVNSSSDSNKQGITSMFGLTNLPSGYVPSKKPNVSQDDTGFYTNSKPKKYGNISSFPSSPGALPFSLNSSLPFINDCDTSGIGFGSTTWLIIGLILQGIGWSFIVPLSVTYIDDSFPVHETVFYAALLFLAMAFGPIVGFLCSAFTLTFFVDFDRVDTELIPELNQYDPRWMGAWWFGYIIFGTAMMIISIPFFLFPVKMPSRFKESKAKEADIDDAFVKAMLSKPKSDKGFMNRIKGFFQALKRLILNPPLVSLYLGASSDLAVMSIFVAFVIKYITSQFGITPITGTIIVGSVVAPCSMVGNLFAGAFCRKFKLGSKKTSLFIIGSTAIILCTLPVLLFVGCNNPEVAGVTTQYRKRGNQLFVNASIEQFQSTMNMKGSDLPNLKSGCNSECSCSDQMFLPVCGSDGVTYTSGCHAGCSHKSTSGKYDPFSSNTNYTGCTCISDPESEDGYGHAVSGSCSYECSTLPLYVVLTVLMTIASGTFGSPMLSVMLRVVGDEDRSLAVGLQQSFTKVLGYFPAPIYFGAVINSVCLLWQKTCGDEGACLMYDIEKYRYAYYGLMIGLKLISLIMYIIMYSTIKEKNDGQYNTVKQEEPGSPLPLLNGDGAAEPVKNKENEISV